MHIKNWKEKQSSGVAWLHGIRIPDYWFESQSAYFLTSGSERSYVKWPYSMNDKCNK